MMRFGVFLPVLAVLVLTAGCGGGVTFSGKLLQPARVSARAYPTVWIVSAPDPMAEEVALGVASF
ncbi:MAG: hypothetical protein KC417_14635, partial [Myxococcales bacterium]|nr:hypothetical protein [Myxococcales bacterium]